MQPSSHPQNRCLGLGRTNTVERYDSHRFYVSSCTRKFAFGQGAVFPNLAMMLICLEAPQPKGLARKPSRFRIQFWNPTNTGLAWIVEPLADQTSLAHMQTARAAMRCREGFTFITSTISASKAAAACGADSKNSRLSVDPSSI